MKWQQNSSYEAGYDRSNFGHYPERMKSRETNKKSDRTSIAFSHNPHLTHLFQSIYLFIK
jgi:hypothetical protein